MRIADYVNRIFKGYDFDCWVNDETYPLNQLKEIGHPFSLACIEIDENTLIAVDTENIRQREFIENNLHTNFILDASIYPRKVKTMLYGQKNIYFAKKHTPIDYKNIGIRNRFTINVFKTNNSTFGSPLSGSFAGIEIHDAFSEIIKEFNQLVKDQPKLIDEEIGSLFIQVDYLNEEPYFKTTIKSSRFSIDEIKTIILAIRKDTITMYS